MLVRVDLFVEVSSFAEAEKLADSIRAPDTVLELSDAYISRRPAPVDPDDDDIAWGRD